MLRSGAVSVWSGLLLGLSVALALSAGLEATVSGLDARDPVIFALVPLLLSLTALGAIWIPARKAAALDPVTSVRAQ